MEYLVAGGQQGFNDLSVLLQHVLLELTEITVPPHVQINIMEKTVVSNVIVDLMKSVTLYTAVEVLPLVSYIHK